MVCPNCKAELRSLNAHIDPWTFTTHHGFLCDACKWRGWIGMSIEEIEDKVYNETHIQMGLDRLWEQRHKGPLRQVYGARLSYLLNALDRLAGEL